MALQRIVCSQSAPAADCSCTFFVSFALAHRTATQIKPFDSETRPSLFLVDSSGKVDKESPFAFDAPIHRPQNLSSSSTGVMFTTQLRKTANVNVEQHETERKNSLAVLIYTPIDSLQSLLSHPVTHAILTSKVFPTIRLPNLTVGSDFF